MLALHSAVPGEGERLQRERTRRHYAIKGALFVIGMISGAYLGYSLASSDFDVAAPWPRSIALSMAAVYLIAIGLGSLLLNSSIDELEKHRTYKAVALAGSVYMIVYPVWFLLWKGSMAIEPIHWLLFLGFWLLMIGGSVYYRFR